MTGSSKFAKLLQRFRRESRAAAMVEFAIIAPLLFALIFGIIDFGRIFFLYNNLTNAAREGARLGSVYDPVTPNVIPIVQAATRARINDAGGAAANVDVTYQGANPGRTIRVRIRAYPFRPVTFLVFNAARTLNVQAEFRLETQ